MSARSRRGGREGRNRRAKMTRIARMSRMARAEREEAGDDCLEAPASMPVVQRLQHGNAEQRSHSATNGRRMRSG